MARILKNIPQRDEFYIITNGKRTEYNYFNLIKKKKSIYEKNNSYFNIFITVFVFL